ncbi:MAG: sulfotransferase [bacterium]|nr:sulfotransferase [bacterium]
MSSPISPLGSLTRAFNRGGRVIQRTGVSLIRLEPEALLDEARRRARLEDFDEDGFREAFRRVVHSFDREAGLTLLGRIAARQDLLRLLKSRLQLVDDRRRHPDIAAESVRRPIFVTGLPRTGTTLLHGLLAQDPASRAPLHWESVFPSPPDRSRARVRRRIDAAARQLRWFHRLNPDIRRMHPLGATLPEECLIITSHAFLSYQFQTSHHVPSYQAWLETQDLVLCYAWHRRFLQHLQWRGRGERWVLKAPAHLFGIPALFATYPDAAVVFTHRDPTEVAASLASLTTFLRRTFSDQVDPRAVGTEMTARWARGIYKALADRDAGCAPAGQFLDVRYTDLVRDPIGTVRHLYAHFDMPFTAVAEERMRRFLAANPKDKNGRHVYTLGDFGLDADAERARYRAYLERFGL